MNSDLISLSEDQKILAKKIHQQAIIIDGLTYMSEPPKDDLYLNTLIESGITASNFTVPYPTDSFDKTIDRLAEWYDSVEKFSDIFCIATSAMDIRRAKQEGRTAIIIGFQETKPFRENLKYVNVFHKLGVKITTLTYQYRNAVGGSCAQQDNDAGLTPFGKEMIRKLNDTGILVDLSHVGPQTCLDTVKISTKPVVASHVGLMNLKKHVRNISNELMYAIAENGGVIGLPSYTQFLGVRDPNNGTILDFLDAIDYIVKSVGEDHVAIAFDFCPTWNEGNFLEAQATFPEIYLDIPYQKTNLQGLKSIKDCISVTEGLVERGYSETAIKKILGENFLRVFDQVW